jgi:hypothetical protein
VDQKPTTSQKKHPNDNEEALTPQEVREIETEVKLEDIATIGWFGRGFQIGLGAALAFALVAFLPERSLQSSSS